MIWKRACKSTSIRSALTLLLAGTVLVLSACGDSDNATPAPTATPTATPAPTATPTSKPATPLAILKPANQQLSLAGSIAVAIQLPAGGNANSLSLTLDGKPVTVALTVANGQAQGTLPGLAPGLHTLQASFDAGAQQATASFETVALTNPDQCEVLNSAECLLPYPSSRFLVPADTATGWRISFPAAGMPVQGDKPLPPEPYSVLDGFSPTVQILMHFPGGVDPTKSNAPRLLPDTRTYDARSLDTDSPTVLLDAYTNTRVLHFVEPDAQAEGHPDRQTLFLRPARSLTPGHRYIVAVRHLVHPDGTAVTAEPVFAALRDQRPTDIPAILSRRTHFEDIFSRLTAAGVARQDLVLAFDFVVQSNRSLTAQMLSMRDQGFLWLDARAAAATKTFAVTNVTENDCTTPGVRTWRVVDGTYQVPLFLTADPVEQPAAAGFLNVDADGMPVQSGVTNPPFTIAIPCTVLEADTPKRPVLIGHGLFGTGREMIATLLSQAATAGFDLILGATDWRGLSDPDLSQPDFVNSFLAHVVLNLQDFAALADRMRQGQVNNLVLAHMMKSGAFNIDPAFQTPAGTGVFAGPHEAEFYFGASLGGIMGMMFAALSPDVANANIDVPGMNFSLLLQRSTEFSQIEGILILTGLADPMQRALTYGILHELWVRGESAGYATHVTSNPLPGTNPKNILMTMAWLDPQVSNVATEIAARTLGLPNLIGSLRTGLVDIPDKPGPLASALVIYDTGSFNLANPAHAKFIPPLANLAPQTSCCDPHPVRGFIPASVEQLQTFLQPGGQIMNFCDGMCDAGQPSEIPYGNSTPCDPLACSTGS
ncbi:MAG: hypothetical protein H6Q33_2542 [Deltaproteobacteria bacterium]|nr:hypothetical protein [Deltaproteobacteria bacterium]